MGRFGVPMLRPFKGAGVYFFFFRGSGFGGTKGPEIPLYLECSADPHTIVILGETMVQVFYLRILSGKSR